MAVFGPVDYSRLQVALASRQAWIELVIIAACAFIAWLVDSQLERRRAARVAASSTPGLSLQGFAHAFFPLVALALLFVVRSAYRQYAPPLFLDIALPLAAAFAAIRVLVYALRRLFPRQRWLPAWERGLTVVVLAVLVLHFVGVLPEMMAELDRIVVPLGSNEISLLAIAKGFLVVVVTLVITLWLSGLLEQRLMRSETLEGNVRVVLAKFVRAVLLAVAVLLSLQAVGIDLTVLTVFGGAVGVGIGLGLQKLASNYIAGFTILLDRSIRIGDLVTVDNRHGTVAKVTSRYVVVRSGDGVEAIVPNETLVTTTVLNHSYTSKDVRMAVNVQVTHEADVERALQLMEEVAATEPRVLKTPPARAFVVRFADNGIDLELGVWMNDPEAGQLELKSALNRKILAAFRAQGIALASTPRELKVVVPPGSVRPS
ncbi:MAG TPA: mechanosensitive ion channel domain-containing protein [Casimicrobiaceae bacterium]|nr:mechanosensitive ion channel domain-containing protein [Casimicrobiaceae bacterium]